MTGAVITPFSLDVMLPDPCKGCADHAIGGKPADVKFYSPFMGDRRLAAVVRRILQICDSSGDVPGEIEALLRDEFAKVARHA